MGVNGEDKGVFFSGVNTKNILWAMVDVYGNSNAIELYDPRRHLNNIINNNNQNLCEDIYKMSEKEEIANIKSQDKLKDQEYTKQVTLKKILPPVKPRQSTSPPLTTECLICCDNLVDRVLYSCGHVCLCL